MGKCILMGRVCPIRQQLGHFLTKCQNTNLPAVHWRLFCQLHNRETECKSKATFLQLFFGLMGWRWKKKHNENITSNSSLPLLHYATWQNKIRQVQTAGSPLMCCRRETPQSSILANPFTSVLQLSFTLTDWKGQHTSSPSEAQNKSTPSLPH